MSTALPLTPQAFRTAMRTNLMRGLLTVRLWAAQEQQGYFVQRTAHLVEHWTVTGLDLGERDDLETAIEFATWGLLTDAGLEVVA